MARMEIYVYEDDLDDLDGPVEAWTFTHEQMKEAHERLSRITGPTFPVDTQDLVAMMHSLTGHAYAEEERDVGRDPRD